MTESSINPTKYSGEYGIPYLRIHKINLNMNQVIRTTLTNLISTKLLTKTIGPHMEIMTPML